MEIWTACQSDKNGQTFWKVNHYFLHSQMSIPTTFRSETLLELAQLAAQAQDSFSSVINDFKQEWLKSFGERVPTREDFENERGVWNSAVFIPGIQDEAKKERLAHLLRIKGTKGRSNARKENEELKKELSVFDNKFNNIANEMFGMPVSSFKRRRDPIHDEEQLYDTGINEIKFGIQLLKTLFPAAKNILECCAGNGCMVAELEKAGYNVTALDINPKCSAVQYCDIFKEHFPSTFDVVFTNPPFKKKGHFFDVMYSECYQQGKGFCVMLPFDADSQKGVATSIQRMVDEDGLQKHNMIWTPEFKKDGKDCKPVGKCSWFVGGYTLVPSNKKALRTYNYMPGDIV